MLPTGAGLPWRGTALCWSSAQVRDVVLANAAGSAGAASESKPDLQSSAQPN